MHDEFSRQFLQTYTWQLQLFSFRLKTQKQQELIHPCTCFNATSIYYLPDTYQTDPWKQGKLTILILGKLKPQSLSVVIKGINTVVHKELTIVVSSG